MSITGEPIPGLVPSDVVKPPGSESKPPSPEISNRKNDSIIIEVFANNERPLDDLPQASPNLQRAMLETLRKLATEGNGTDLKKIVDLLRRSIDKEDIRIGVLESGKLAGYTIVKNIGYGAHGNVFEALDEKGRKVIIKSGKEQKRGSAEDNIEIEARAIGNIRNLLTYADRDHSQVPLVLALDKDGYSSPVFAETYIEGARLDGILASGKRYPPSVVNNLLNRLTEVGFVINEAVNQRDLLSRVPDFNNPDNPKNVVLAIERDRRPDTIIVDPETLELRGLIDFSLPGYTVEELTENPDFVRKNKQENVIVLGKTMVSLCDINQADAHFKEITTKMISGEIADFASVYKELNKQI